MEQHGGPRHLGGGGGGGGGGGHHAAVAAAAAAAANQQAAAAALAAAAAANNQLPLIPHLVFLIFLSFSPQKYFYFLPCLAPGRRRRRHGAPSAHDHLWDPQGLRPPPRPSVRGASRTHFRVPGRSRKGHRVPGRSPGLQRAGLKTLNYVKRLGFSHFSGGGKQCSKDFSYSCIGNTRVAANYFLQRKLVERYLAVFFLVLVSFSRKAGPLPTL